MSPCDVKTMPARTPPHAQWAAGLHIATFRAEPLVRPPLLRGLLCAALLCVCLAAPSASGAEPKDPLLRAYTSAPGEKRDLLRECDRRLRAIRFKALSSSAEQDWGADQDVRWLLAHRIPAVLAMEQELQRGATGRHLGALLYLTERLGHRRLTRELPALLSRAGTDEDRFQLLHILAELRSDEALKALGAFLRGAESWTSERLVCEAARGLSLTGDERYLPLIRAAGRLVSSPAGAVRLAAARHRCGDPGAVSELLKSLRDESADPAAVISALRALADRPVAEAVPDLAALAVRAQDAPVAEAAIAALMQTTGYDAPSGEIPGESARQEDVTDDADAEKQEGPDAALGRWGSTARPKREEVVQRILEWWQNERAGAVAPTIWDVQKLAPGSNAKPY